MEILDELIAYLIKENRDIATYKIPTQKEEKGKLYRSLCNIREPKPISKKYLKLEEQYLQEERKKRKTISVEEIETLEKINPKSPIQQKEKIALWQGDITLLKIQAIVNAANSQGLGCFFPCHTCIDNQIHTYAGIKLRLECEKIMKQKGKPLNISEVMITKGYQLPAQFVFHTVGPIIYHSVTKVEENQLADCYLNCLQMAIQKRIRTIAFPCISTGEFHFPKELACQIAIKTVETFLEQHEDQFDKIVFNVWGEEDKMLYEKYMG